MCWEQTDLNLLYKSRFFDPCIDFKWESFLWMEVGMFVIFNYWLALCMSVAVTVQHCVDAFLPRMQRGVWAMSRWDAVLPVYSESIYYDRKSGAWGMIKYMVMQWWLSHTHWHVNTENNVLVSIHMLNIHIYTSAIMTWQRVSTHRLLHILQLKTCQYTYLHFQRKCKLSSNFQSSTAHRTSKCTCSLTWSRSW